MDIPPENLSLIEANLTPADEEPADAPTAADFAKRLEAFQAETRRCKEYINFNKNVGGAGIVFTLLGLPLFLFHSIVCSIGASLVLIGLITIVVSVLMCGALFSSPSAATIRMTEDCRPQAIKPLLERLEIHQSTQETKLIYQTVNILVERMTPDEADALPRDVRDRFNRRLADAGTTDDSAADFLVFGLAWLKILTQIGGKRDLYAVKPLAKLDEYGHFCKTLGDAARDCLPQIEARIAAQEPGRTLLRASNSPPSAPETLLRPAAKSNPSAPQELLRPAEPEAEQGKPGE